MRSALIIGGGVIGLGIARELHKDGVSDITVLEKNVCGRESSWAAAGMLAPQAEADEAGDFFDLCSSSRHLFPAFAAELLDETGIDIELERSGMIYLAFSNADEDELRERFNWQKRSELEVELLSATETLKLEPSISPAIRGSLLFPNDWQVDNRKLVTALRKYAADNGIRICEDERVVDLVVEDGQVSGAETESTRFLADQTVLTTGAWTSLIKIGGTRCQVDIEPVRGQMVEYFSSAPIVRHVIYSKDGYLVPRRDGRILVGSTAERVEFDDSVSETVIARLGKMASRIVPDVAKLEVVDSWIGFRPCSTDGLPVFGTTAGIGRLTFATGHFRNGILLTPITAKIVSKLLVNGAKSPYLDRFSPDRFAAKGVGTGS